MKTKDALNLKPGDKVIHSYFGLSTVDEVMTSFDNLFGIIISPSTEEGKHLITANFEIPGDTPFLEDSPRRLKLA